VRKRLKTKKIVGLQVIEKRARNSALLEERKLGSAIKCCEVVLSPASTRAWEDKIKNARRIHHTALRFVHYVNVSGYDAHRINQRVTLLKRF
jgi:hypothetical protein